MGSMKTPQKQTTTPLFFEDKPLFGLDIGKSSLRVVQLEYHSGKPRMIGYGSARFEPSAVIDGIVTQPELIAQTVLDLFRHNIVGDITTNRVAVSLPVARAFTRSVETPDLSPQEIAEAVHTEAEQYIPAAIDDLYLDYSTLGKDANEAFLVAMPKKIVDSHLLLTRMLGLEAVLFETSIGAGAKLFGRDQHQDLPTVLIDFGSESADITIYRGGLTVTGTVACGGEKITKLIMEALDVSEREANIIKSKYGLGFSKKQDQIVNALKPVLTLLLKEIKRTMRYFEERSGSKDAIIAQILIMGGGANMPGIADYLTNELRIPVRSFDPTAYIDFGKLQPIPESERMSYVTATGLALTNPREVFA